MPFLALFGLVALIAAVARAINWRRFREAENNPQWDRAAETTPALIWKEIKLLFDFNRFT